jgi:hypothetical protein
MISSFNELAVRVKKASQGIAVCLKSLFSQGAQKCPDANVIEGRKWWVECGLNEFTTNYSLLSTFGQEGNPAYRRTDACRQAGAFFSNLTEVFVNGSS